MKQALPANVEQRILALLKRPPGRYKFKHIVSKLKVAPHEVERAIADLRKTQPNLVFAKFDRTFYLSDTPTHYNFQTDLSRHMPLEGSIGVVSDTHLCSNAERLDIVNLAYDTFEKRGIKQVFHAGDNMDGMDVYRGHNNNIKVFGEMAQAKYFIKNYPKKPGITTYTISGNHDLSSYLKTGSDMVSLVVNGFRYEGRDIKGRDDIKYLGHYAHRLILPQQITVELVHPLGSNPYSKSYKQQRRSENMDRNSRPDLQISGHFHDFNFMWAGGTYFLAMPGFQDATEYFKRLGLPRGMGFVVLHYKIADGKFKSLSPELFMFE
jgi:predicted phosphodiesterase